MKQLMLVRHAKSSWSDPSCSDFDRPLNERGQRDAPEMGRRFLSRAWLPDRIVSSPAHRAKTTAEHLADAFSIPRQEIQFEPGIYEASAAELLRVVCEVPDAVECVLLVGHNPGMTRLANRLGTLDIANVPTCGIVRLTFDVNTWAELANSIASATDFDYPKNRD